MSDKHQFISIIKNAPYFKTLDKDFKEAIIEYIKEIDEFPENLKSIKEYIIFILEKYVYKGSFDDFVDFYIDSLLENCNDKSISLTLKNFIDYNKVYQMLSYDFVITSNFIFYA